MKLFQKNELKLLWPFYLEQLIANLFWIILPFEVIYFTSIGLSPVQIGIIMAAWSLSALLFEIPTGAIADLYGRKFSVILGFSLMGIIFAFIPFFSNFYILVLLYFLIGIAFTFTSGSYDAWIVDLLEYNKMKESVKDYFHTSFILYNLAAIFSGIIGVYLVAKYTSSVIWPVSMVAFLIGVGLLCFGREHHKREKIRIKESLKKTKDQIKSSLKYAYNSPVLFYLLLVSFIFGVSGSLGSFVSITSFLVERGINESYFGYLASIGALMGILATFVSSKFSKKYSPKKILILGALMFLIQAILIFYTQSLLMAFSVIIFGYFIIAFQVPSWQIYFQRNIPSKLRATIGSVNGMLSSLAQIFGLISVGFIIESIGARFTLIIAGLLGAFTIVFYLSIREKRSK